MGWDGSAGGLREWSRVRIGTAWAVGAALNWVGTSDADWTGVSPGRGGAGPLRQDRLESVRQAGLERAGWDCQSRAGRDRAGSQSRTGTARVGLESRVRNVVQEGVGWAEQACLARVGLECQT